MAYYVFGPFIVKDIRDDFQALHVISILLFFLLLFDLWMIISTAMRINAYRSIPTVVSEKLDGVEWGNFPIDLHAGGNVYNLEKDTDTQNTLMVSSMISYCIR